MTAKPPYLPLPTAKRRKVGESSLDCLQTPSCNNVSTTNNHSNDAIIIFDRELSKLLTTHAVRLPTQYIGVRRVRPSSRTVHRVFVETKQQQKESTIATLTSATNTSLQHHGTSKTANDTNENGIEATMSSIMTDTKLSQSGTTEASKDTVNRTTFKVIDPITGVERRMNSKEKRDLKFRIASEKKAVKNSAAAERHRLLIEYQSKNSKKAMKRQQRRQYQQQQLKQQEQQTCNADTEEAKPDDDPKNMDLTEVEGFIDVEKNTELTSEANENEIISEIGATADKMEFQNSEVASDELQPMSIQPLQETMDLKQHDQATPETELLPDKTTQETSTEEDPTEQQFYDEAATKGPESCLSNLNPVAASSSDSIDNGKNNRNYWQMPIDTASFEQELADLRGERDGVPPVVLPPPLAAVALRYQRNLFLVNDLKTNTTPISNSDYNEYIQSRKVITVLDDDLAQEWAVQLKNSMKPAERNRQKEDMRLMPYELIPEPWKRLRPSELCSLDKNEINDNDATVVHELSNNLQSSNDEHYGKKTLEDTKSDTASDKKINGSDESTNNSQVESSKNSSEIHSWSWCKMRSTFHPSNNSNSCENLSTLPFDRSANIIIDFLYKKSNSLHIACGAKFGCDYLLYDGPRNERHAFAGLRIIPYNAPPEPDHNGCFKNTAYTFPLPTPYALSGFVRCLNTAGKLALLATVVTTKETLAPQAEGLGQEAKKTITTQRVVIIDLALEKVIATTINRPKKTLEDRLKLLSKA